MEKTEQNIFDEIGKLCISPGYIHALAFIYFNDNFIGIDDELSGRDFLKMYSWERLNRSEIMTLVGLMVKRPIDFTLPDPATIREYINETQRLMKELHAAISGPLWEQCTPENVNGPNLDPFDNGSALREPMFYSGEAAYAFQLRDFALPKYAADNAWLKQHKGFSIDEAHSVVRSFTELQNQNLTDLLATLREKPPFERSVLEGLSVATDEIVRTSGIDGGVVQRVLSTFALPVSDRNSTFLSQHDFNACTATPLIERESGAFILFSHHSLMQSLYESPFYWMIDDLRYKENASVNRGHFVEDFVSERLAHVFGEKQVFQGVRIHESKGKERSEIDVLAFFGNRAIVVQAKSKKLTLKARKGNDEQIKADFQKAVQEAYDQGRDSSLALLNPAFQFRDNAGQSLKIPALKEIFIVTTLSEAYPALAFQARQYLRYERTDVIRPPVVTDIFAIDAMTEMLDSPLWFIDYLRRRSEYSDKLHVPDELTALSFHLKQGLWLEEQYNFVSLSDDISCDLDAAMTVRREGITGRRTPDGILTHLAGSTIEKILREIEAKPTPETFDFAFTVLSCSEEATKKLSEAIDEASDRFERDGRGHDFIMSLRSTPAVGLVIHCNEEAVEKAWRSLQSHCERRKYIHRADTWYGICISPRSKKVRFGIGLEFVWEHDAAMERRTRDLQNGKVPKVGRNDFCPCGSGKKYKKCHGR